MIWLCHKLGVGCRLSSDPAQLWLWRRPMATALIRPLAWEPPYTAGAALKKRKKEFLDLWELNFVFKVNFTALCSKRDMSFQDK